ncbi:D-alanyl-D-alanine endopeptidase [Oceanisphaera ostreae]|uniref:D-alanyl-D-alanine endopeptidase n=1 Tax=Oceanisphaera ostreae TaxID=914151 RepID=A0ABW3KK74_9GAMM
MIISNLIKPAVLTICLLAGSAYIGSSYAATTPLTSSTTQQNLAAGSALLVDLKTNEILYANNENFVAPIASVTKLMTAMVAIDAQQSLEEKLPIVINDTTEMQGVFSRVRLGSELSRHDLLLITLMSSENRAAASLAHHYRGGHAAFIQAMNDKAHALGMHHSDFVEPTGLSEKNVSSAHDLVLLIKAARDYPLIRMFSTMDEKTVAFTKPNYTLSFRNTNALVRNDNWNIALSKTGFTNSAGHCLVMSTEMNQRPVAFVVLDAFGKYTHMADANRLKRWLETGTVTPVPAAALDYKKAKQQEREKQALARE